MDAAFCFSRSNRKASVETQGRPFAQTRKRCTPFAAWITFVPQRLHLADAWIHVKAHSDHHRLRPHQWGSHGTWSPRCLLQPPNRQEPRRWEGAGRLQQACSERWQIQQQSGEMKSIQQGYLTEIAVRYFVQYIMLGWIQVKNKLWQTSCVFCISGSCK